MVKICKVVVASWKNWKNQGDITRSVFIVISCFNGHCSPVVRKHIDKISHRKQITDILDDTPFVVCLFPVVNGTLFVQKTLGWFRVGVSCRRAYQPTVLRMSLISYVLNADSGR